MANFWDEVLGAITGAVTHPTNPIAGAATGFIGTSMKKGNPGAANQNAANQFYQQELQQGQDSYSRLMQLLPALLSNAGIGANGQQQPYSPSTDPQYQNAFAGFQQQENQALRNAEAAATGQRGQGIVEAGTGPGYYGYQGAIDTANFNRNWMSQEQQRQQEALSQVMALLSGTAGRAQQGAAGVLNIGNAQAALGRQQSQNQSNALTGALDPLTAALGSLIHKATGGLPRTAGSGGGPNNTDYGPTGGGALNYPNPTSPANSGQSNVGSLGAGG